MKYGLNFLIGLYWNCIKYGNWLLEFLKLIRILLVKMELFVMMLFDIIKFFRIKLSNIVGKGEIWLDIVLMI